MLVFAEMDIKKVISAVLLLLSVNCLSACREELVHGLNEMQSIELQRALAEQGLAARSVFDGKSWNLTVANEDLEMARASLVSNRNILRPQLPAETQVPSLFSSRDERIWYQTQQVGQAIASSLQILPGVLDARVHLSRTPGSFWEKEVRIESASVLLLVREEAELDEEAIRMLVAKGSGCAASNIAVVSQVETESSAKFASRPMTGTTIEGNDQRKGQQLSGTRQTADLESTTVKRSGNILSLSAIFLVLLALALKHRSSRLSGECRAEEKMKPQSLFIRQVS